MGCATLGLPGCKKNGSEAAVVAVAQLADTRPD